VNDSRDDIEDEPGDAEDDRLHRVKPDETVSFLQNVKDDSADQRNTGDRRRHIRRQIH